MVEKKGDKKEPIKPVLIVPWIDKDGHAVFKTTNKKDAETLNAALDNPSGVLVQEPEEEDKVCPSEPDKRYEESVCYKMLKAFKKDKEKKSRKRERKKVRLSKADCKLFYQVIYALIDAKRKELAESVLEWVERKVNVKI